jgi:hypothetical protein
VGAGAIWRRVDELGKGRATTVTDSAAASKRLKIRLDRRLRL